MTEKQQLLIALRTGEMPAERSGEYWSEEELQLLKRLYCEDGIDISDITLQLGRSELAVCQQLTKLGLLSPQGKPRARNKKPLTAQCLCPLCQVSDCAHCEKECLHAGTV